MTNEGEFWLGWMIVVGIEVILLGNTIGAWVYFQEKQFIANGYTQTTLVGSDYVHWVKADEK